MTPLADQAAVRTQLVRTSRRCAAASNPARVRVGARVPLRVWPWPFALRSDLEHIDYQEGRSFTDVQVRGPFRYWKHEHRMIPRGPQACVLEDAIDYHSRTLAEGTRDGVTVVRDAASHVRKLKEEDGKPIWLWGGGELFRSLALDGLVDGVDVAIIPILLGGGLPLLPPPGPRLPLRLRSHRLYSKTGTLFMEYDVVR